MILSNGVYLEDENICPEENDEVLAAVIRSRRNRLLCETDKYMLPDFPISDAARAAWMAYRDQLRNITSQAGFPRNVVFPTEVREI